ncbi:MAG TPA: TadE/TadG family type IV pilus assembly protein [Patescibacteria group bacterium]|nr:TadE/TadG family type IV pilus assembly protein [Patescibacteria group bacterium]
MPVFVPGAQADRGSGQSMVEFALTLPILLFLLLTIADFGRYFNAGISVESSARAAAEIAAQEYLRAPTPTDYATIHRDAWSAICDESSSLANVSYPTPGSECSGIPTAVCVHDGLDDQCGTVYNAGGAVPAACPGLQVGSLPTNAVIGESGVEVHTFVEVRVCYRFSTMLNVTLPFIGGSLSPLSGNFYIERTRMFTVANY